MVKCAIKTCKNNSIKQRKKDGVSYFKFPRNPIQREKWRKLVAIERGDEFFKPNDSHVICSDHFVASDIYYCANGMKMKKKAAVPVFNFSSCPSTSTNEDIQMKPSTSTDNNILDSIQPSALIDFGLCPSTSEDLQMQPSTSKDNNISDSIQTLALIDETQNAEVAGPSSQLQAEPQNNQQDICMQIKSSLQQLRRKSNPEPEKPMLELEVFPEPSKDEIDIDDTQQFVDELQPIEEEDPKIEEETKVATKRKITKLQQLRNPKKPKRNPRRKVVTKRLQEESIQAAKNAPGIEKVYLDKPEETKTTDVPTSLEQKEQLYEFGKFVAEQLMTFNQKDVEEAQTEIKEVLKKYRLKHKIMNCLSKTNSTEPPATNKSNETNLVISNGHPKSKSEPRSTTSKPAVQQKSVKQAAIQKTKPSNVSRALVESTITKTYSGKATNVNKGAPECAKQASVVQPPALPTLALGSGNFPLSLVLVPSEDGTLKLTTARVDSTGTIMTFPNAPRVNIEAFTPNLSHPVLPAASDILTTTQSVPKISVGKTVAQTSTPVLTNTAAVSHPVNSKANVESKTNTKECLIEDSNLQNGIMCDPLKVEPSETNEEDIDNEPVLNKEIVSVNQTDTESVVFKCEMSSDEDDDC